MFKKFAAQKYPVIPNEDVRRAVESILIECIKYWNSAANLTPLYLGKDGQEAKKAFDQANEIFYLLQTTAAKILDIWPQGLNLVKEWQKMASLGLDMAENDYNCGKYVHTANIMDKPEFPMKSRDFQARRHQLGDMIDLLQSRIQKMLVSSKINKE